MEISRMYPQQATSLNQTAFDQFGPQSPVPCYQLKLIGLYCTALFILSVAFNSILLITFCKHSELRSPLNTFIIALTALNLFGSVTELPVIILSNFYCRYLDSNLFYITRRFTQAFFVQDGCLEESAVLSALTSCTSWPVPAFTSWQPFRLKGNF